MLPVCPKCDISLLILRFKELEVDYCEQCRGLWLDSGELEQLLAQTGGAPDDVFLRELGLHQQPTRATRFLCPRCDQPLNEVTHPGLVLDVCARHHGIWFDAGELRHLLARLPESAGARHAIELLNEMFGTRTQGETASC